MTTEYHADDRTYQGQPPVGASFYARYRTRCVDCGEPIEPDRGDMIRYNAAREVVHAPCPEVMADVPLGELCPQCFCFHPGEC